MGVHGCTLIFVFILVNAGHEFGCGGLLMWGDLCGVLLVILIVAGGGGAFLKIFYKVIYYSLLSKFFAFIFDTSHL